jgi:hypothetical protein
MGGGGILGSVTDFVGLTDYSGAEERATQAADTTKYSTDVSAALARDNIEFQKQQLEFQKDQYADWKAVYGDLSQNLGEYYKTLSSSTFVVPQLQAQAMEYSKAVKEVTQQLAQRGIQSGGTEAAALTSMAMESAGQRAAIRASAEPTAAKEKLQFLGIGLGQGTNMLGTIAGQASTVGQASNIASSNILQGGIAQGNQLMNMATTQYNASSQMMGNLFQAGGAALGGFFKSDERLKTNIKFDREVDGIKFYTWDWTDEALALGAGNEDTYGVIAQEVAEVYPDVVYDNGNYLMVDYTKLYSKLGV